MSIESAQAFIDKMKSNEEFAKKVTECPDTEARKAFVNTEGFHFSLDEINAAKNALSDEELDSVSGGSLTDYCAWQTSGYWKGFF